MNFYLSLKAKFIDYFNNKDRRENHIADLS